MPNSDDILWFKQEFHQEIEESLVGTPFGLDLLTALACQETGLIWPILRKKSLPRERLLELCVGDTLDEDRGRRAFPRTRAALVAKPNGDAMFAIARQALVDLAQFVPGYKGAAQNPNKFCHGFGIFQYDLQFFLEDPDYFLQKRYADFGACLQKALGELTAALKRIPALQGKTSLSDLESASVAIAYNTGRFRPNKGLKQGFFDGTKFYGEAIFDFLRLSKTVPVPGGEPVLPEPAPGGTPIPPPSPVEATGRFFKVDVRSSPLRLRSEPEIDPDDPTGNVIARLPDGQIVRAVSDTQTNGFLEIETNLLGAHFHGFASAKFLVPAPALPAVPVPNPAVEPPASGVVAVYMPRKPNTVTKRVNPAGPHSLNEPGQPGRQGTTPDALRSELAAIIDWLAVDDQAHLRYQPRNGLTFCNIYAHDYCFLAGVYLPRVWWTAGAIEQLTAGRKVEPLLDKTIDEQRANDLFRWLRDFGLRFGWRQTGTLTKLQLEVNQGAVGLIVARRREDGRSGHIVAVVPETSDQRARRDATGEVVSPLQSQAGVRNFRYGVTQNPWWKGDQFADSAFWIHA